MAKKINLSIDDELLERAEIYAKQNYLSKSGLVSIALVQFLNQNELISSLNSLSVSVRKMADIGEVDPESMEQINAFLTFAKFVTGK